MAKFYVRAAYHNIAVHPDDPYLLGKRWHGQFFVDLVLPFGLRSAPYIFNSVADLVEWIIWEQVQCGGFDALYLDDFITAGPAESLQCSQNLNFAGRLSFTWPPPSPQQMHWPIHLFGSLRN